MKKLLTLTLIPPALLSLTTVARADVIAGPTVTLFYAARLLPWLLVGIAVALTVFLLKKFRKK